MPYYVRDNSDKDFERVEPGLYQVVCSHVVPLGSQQSVYGVKEEVALVFEFSEKMTNGKPFVMWKRYTASLSAKANLRRDLENWRGKQFTKDELDGFDLAKLVGVNAMVNVIHADKDDRKVARITAISKVPHGSAMHAATLREAPQYLLKLQTTGNAGVGDTQGATGEDLPF